MLEGDSRWDSGTYPIVIQLVVILELCLGHELVGDILLGFLYSFLLVLVCRLLCLQFPLALLFLFLLIVGGLQLRLDGFRFRRTGLAFQTWRCLRLEAHRRLQLLLEGGFAIDQRRKLRIGEHVWQPKVRLLRKEVGQRVVRETGKERRRRAHHKQMIGGRGHGAVTGKSRMSTKKWRRLLLLLLMLVMLMLLQLLLQMVLLPIVLVLMLVLVKRTRLGLQTLLLAAKVLRGVAELLVLGQRGDCAEAGAALLALDLHATIGVHPLVPAEIGELRVCLEADLAGEGLHRRVDVLVLLEPRRCGECLAALRTRMTASADVVGANMPL